MDSDTVQTRLLILSDTHARSIESSELPTDPVDVAIHCGDLTDGSSLGEFRSAIRLLESIRAPLKLVIPGNHDFTMDAEAFKRKVAESHTLLHDDIAQTYGEANDAENLFKDIESANVVLLKEGNHCFRLQNGSLLRIYASPYTPSLGSWGFQYDPNRGRDFYISNEVDVVMTHGPPKGIMDYTHGRERAGCPNLFAAIARSKPRLHCFGHIHECWGAKLVTWKEHFEEQPTHFTSIDNDKSTIIAKLQSVQASKFDTSEDSLTKEQKLNQIKKHKCFITSHRAQDKYPIIHGESTLFVNAAVCDSDGEPTQPVWMVELDLQRYSV